ncbi:MAG: hypothetical protein V1900_03230, partial [Candidatus Aenigmatarchaeota archaeon]
TNKTVVFNWSSASDSGCAGFSNYTIQIANKSDCTGLLYESNQTASNYTVNLSNGVYYWRVRGKDRYGNDGSWSNCRNLDVYDNLSISINAPVENQIVHKGTIASLTSTIGNSSQSLAMSQYKGDAKTLLLCHLNDSTTCDEAETPTASSGTGYSAGKYGSGITVNHGDTLSYSASGNINLTHGVVEFWVNLTWNTNDTTANKTFFTARDPSSNKYEIIYSSDEDAIVFFVGSNYTQLKVDWKANEWHHVAAYWNDSASDDVRLYADRVMNSTNGTVFTPISTINLLEIGYDSDSSDSRANATIDELRISNLRDDFEIVRWHNATHTLCTSEDCSWLVQSDYPLGTQTIYANVSKQYHYSAAAARNVVVYGWSNVSIIAPSAVNVGQNISINCLVNDANSTTGIANYQVKIHNETALVYEGPTDASGVVNYTWVTDSIPTGTYTFNCTITHNGTLYYNASVSTVSKQIFANRTLQINITEGNGTAVGTGNAINITLTFYDLGKRIYPQGVIGKIWVEKSSGIYGEFACNSTSQGNCAIVFTPDCTYEGGTRTFLGGPHLDTYYADTNSSQGTITIDRTASCMNSIGLMFEFNISGNSNDAAEVDRNGAGYYAGAALDNYYVCMNDSSLTDVPTFGIVFAGNTFDYINLTTGNSYKMKLSQKQPGNKFIIPVIKGGCNNIREKMPNVKTYGTSKPFSSFIAQAEYPIEVALTYDDIDIVGDFSKSGRFMLTFERNETGNKTQIVIR